MTRPAAGSYSSFALEVAALCPRRAEPSIVRSSSRNIHPSVVLGARCRKCSCNRMPPTVALNETRSRPGVVPLERRIVWEFPVDSRVQATAELACDPASGSGVSWCLRPPRADSEFSGRHGDVIADVDCCGQDRQSSQEVLGIIQTDLDIVLHASPDALGWLDHDIVDRR